MARASKQGLHCHTETAKSPSDMPLQLRARPAPLTDTSVDWARGPPLTCRANGTLISKTKKDAKAKGPPKAPNAYAIFMKESFAGLKVSATANRASLMLSSLGAVGSLS